MKNLLLGLLAVTVLTGCSAKDTEEVNSSSDIINESSDLVVTTDEESILYTGTVIAGSEASDKSLFISNLTPVNSTEANAFDEVVLLLDDVEILDKETGEALSIEEVKVDAVVDVLLIKNAPITMSLPAQIPGMGIVKVEIVN